MNYEQELDQLLEASSENVKESFKKWSQTLNTRFKELIELHLIHLKNISLISGAVAPFSLTLFKGANTNPLLLIIGFILLVGNIALSQLFLSKELEMESKNLTKVMVNYVLALGEKENLFNKNQNHPDRVNSVAELANYADNIDQALINNDQLNLKLTESHRRITRYTRLVMTIFTLGCFSILLSVCGI